jgi:hypothetical protein
MALPFSFSSELKWSISRNGRHGVYENGSDLYAVLIDATNNHVEVWRSTDGGNSWSEQDSAGKPSISTTASRKSVDVVQAGTTLHVAVLRGTGPALVANFSMATNTWGTATAEGSVVSGGSNSGNAPIFLARRSDGDYILVHQGATESVMGTAYRRVTYSRHEGSTWTVAQAVSATGVQSHYDAHAAILGDSDRVHIFYTDSANADLLHRSLTSANVLNAVQTVDASVHVTINHSVGVPVKNGSELFIPYVDSDQNIADVRVNSADSPTWPSPNTGITPSLGPEYTDSNFAGVYDGSNYRVFWRSSTNSGIYQNIHSGTWGTPTGYKAPTIGSTGTGGTGVVGGDGGATNERQAQAFTGVAGQPASVRIRASKQGTPTDDLIVEIVTALTGGTVLASGTVSAASITASSGWNEIPLTGWSASLVSGTTYYLMLRRSGAYDTSNAVVATFSGSSTYAGGAKWTRASGTWTENTAQDMAFLLPSSPITQGINVSKITDALAVLYGDEGVVKYDAISLAPPSTPKTGSDAGAESEAQVTAAALPQPDAAAGADTGSLAAASAQADAASASEAQAIAQAKASADSGAESDAGTLTVGQPQADAGSAGDVAASPSAALAQPDAGSLAAAGALAASASPQSDAASVAEAQSVTISLDVAQSDAGSVGDAGALAAGQPQADAGSESGAQQTGAVHGQPDAAGLDDAGLVSVPVASTDAGSGTEMQATGAALAQPDAGAVAESQVPGFATSDTDAASVGDAGTLAAAFAQPDAATGDDAGALLVGLAGADAGAESEEHLVAAGGNRSSSDSGSGDDAGALTAAIGAPDAGSLGDVGGVTAPKASADAASVADAGSLVVSIVQSDAASVGDLGTLETAADKFDADSATGSETQASGATLGGVEAGTAGDAGALAAGTPSLDSGTLADAQQSSASLAQPDAATGGDVGQAVRQVAGSDSGSGADAGAVVVVLATIDAMGVVELAAPAAFLTALDAGAFADAGSVEYISPITPRPNPSASLVVSAAGTLLGASSPVASLVVGNPHAEIEED